MKHLIFIFCVLLSASAFAETRLSVGVGLNFNTIDVENDLKDFDEEVSGNLAIAGKAEIDLNEQWLFRTGLWLQEKSAKLSYDKDNIEGDLSIVTSYLSVPLTVQYEVAESIGIFGGYIADIRINDYCKADGDFDDCSVGKDTQSLVHLATLGLSVNANEHFAFDFSWQHGMTDVLKDGYKMNTFQMMAFYKF